MKTKADILWSVIRWRRIFNVLLFLLLCVVAKAQVYTDTLNVTVYFPCGSSNIAVNPNNTLSLGQFIHQLDSVGQMYVITPISLSLTSSASPEGGIKINRLLSRRRGESALNYLISHSEQFKAISQETECVIEELTTNHLRCKISRSKYPNMRYAKVTLHYKGESKNLPDTTVSEIVPEDTIITPVIQENDSIKSENEVVEEPLLDLDRQENTFHPILFVKTNLLYDLLTCVNASLEVPLTKKLTAEATYVNPWWRNTSNHKTLQIRYLGFTPRYYFTNCEKPYTSFYAGLTVGGGKYDLQWTRRGVQGSMWHISPTIGYTHYISKRWKMEYSASIGYIQTKYTKYTQVDETPYGIIKVRDYPWVSHVMRTVLPTSLNVSIVYTFTK